MMSADAAQRVKSIVDDLLAIRIADLGNQTQTQQKLRDLHSSLDQVQSFAQSIETLIGRFDPPRRGPGRPRKYGAAPVATASAAAAPRRKPGRPPGSGTRRPGEFSATPFILDSVRNAGATGIRPREIVEQIQQVVPGRHVRPSALVSTILTRLKRRGDVKRRAGKWFGA